MQSAASTWKEQHPDLQTDPHSHAPVKTAGPNSDPSHERIQREVEVLNQMLHDNQASQEEQQGASEASAEAIIADADLPSAPQHAYWVSSTETSPETERLIAS